MGPKNCLMILILSTILALGAVGSHSKDPETESLRLAARDAISLTINEVSNTRKFVNNIPRLKTLQTFDTPVLVDCIGGLINGLSNARSVLKRMQHLNKNAPLMVHYDAKALKNMVNQFGSFNDMCRFALRDVDRTVMVMLNRKLDDVMMLSDDVVHKVSRLKL